MVTERASPLRLDGRVIHQIGLPFHWGRNGYTSGDAANDLTSIVLDPSAHIEEVKALTADIHPGRRPRGDALRGYVETVRDRAGVTEKTGAPE
jgi:formate dehydrogenase major subunit